MEILETKVDVLTQRIAQIVDHHLKHYNKLNGLEKSLLELDYTSYINQCRFNDNRYSRVVIFANDKFEIILIGWKPGQYSPCHDHSKNGCCLIGLKGKVQEKRYFYDTSMHLSIIHPSDMSYICNEQAVHSIENIFDENAITLHIYSPPGYISDKIKL